MALLRRLFPGRLQGSDLMEALCPGGWRRSPLRLALHPTPERQWEEAVAMRKNLARLAKIFGSRRKGKAEGRKRPSLDPLPSKETFLAEARAKPDRQSGSDVEELGRLVGLCLWDVLSDSHDLILPDGVLKHMGSFRMTAGILADFFYDKVPAGDEPAFDFSCRDMDYCEFYMGTWAIGRRTDLEPVYRLIFQRLRALDYAWQYAFPKLGVVRFDKPEPEDGGQDWREYDPSAALAHEKTKAEKDAEFARLQRDLDESHRKALQDAKNRPPPPTVLAYRNVFGHWPAGWPPWE